MSGKGNSIEGPPAAARSRRAWRRGSRRISNTALYTRLSRADLARLIRPLLCAFTPWEERDLQGRRIAMSPRMR